MSWEQWLSVAALLLAVAAVIVGTRALRQLNKVSPSQSDARPPAPHTADSTDTEELPQPPAFIVNPTKVNSLLDFRKIATALAQEHSLGVPLWFETTVEDPGTGQALDAIDQGASTVIAVGGDGTVRAVAEGLAGSNVPMGLVPMGTGNLLARNLDLPMNGTRALITTALTAPTRRIDIGWAYPEGEGDLPSRTPFLVIAGVGFDAAMVADADEELKARMGWLAYFFAGARHLHGKKIRVRITLDEDKGIATRKVRSVLVANVGRLPGGFVLFPDAEADDGLLDIATIDTRGSLVGWASLFGTVVLQGLGMRKYQSRPTSDLEFWRTTSTRIDIDQPSNLQVDGDLIGPITSARFALDSGALVVRLLPET